MLHLRLRSATKGESLISQLNAYNGLIGISTQPVREMIQWFKDLNLENATEEEYYNACAVVIRAPLRYPFPWLMNVLLPQRLQRPKVLKMRFGIIPSREYKDLYVNCRAEVGGGTENYIGNNDYERRFYPKVESILRSII